MKTTCAKCGSKNIVHVQYPYGDPHHYDGWSEVWCLADKCGAHFGRWSGRELDEGESEPPFGVPVKLTKKVP